MKRVFAFLMFAAIAAGAQSTAAKHPFTFEDMMKLKRVNEPVPSPDGKWVAFSAVDVDLAANTKTPHIWIVPADGSAKERLLIATPQGEDRPRWSPDGKFLSFTASYDGSQQIWVTPFDSANGHVAPDLRSARAEQSSVPTQTDPWAHKLTSISTGADGQQWSPDGKNILFVSAVYPDCDSAPDQDACNKQEDDNRAALKVRAQIFTHLLYRHWKTYSTAKRSHLFVQPVNADSSPSGRAYDITPGDHDVPPFSLGGADMYSWAPDGKEVAYTSNIDEVEATSTNNEVFVVKLADAIASAAAHVTPDLRSGNQTHASPSGMSSRAEQPQAAQSRDLHFAAKKISTSPGSDSTPRYSPDGKYIAYLSQARAGYESDRFRLMLYERATGKITELTKEFDRWVGSFAWGPDSRFIYFSAEDKGEAPIYRLTVDSKLISEMAKLDRQTKSGGTVTIDDSHAGKVVEIVAGHNDDVSITSDGEHLIFTRMSAAGPNEIFTEVACAMCVSGGRLRCADDPETGTGECTSEAGPALSLTKINNTVMESIAQANLEPFWFTGAAQTKVQGFIIRPPNFDATKKYPVKFLIHGGPQGAWGDSWTYRWNAQLFAANGYVVIMINPRGSTGYGQKFIDEINSDWGGKPITDLMLGLDYAIRRYPFIDGNRVCAMGASYGGYAVDWLIGHTNRFKCAVSHDGQFNTVSAYGTTEELWFPEWEFKGTPYTPAGRAMYERWNPLNSVKNFKTPTLVSHGQLDYRLDVSEGFQLFTALQKQKVPSKMLYFPDEGHWVLKPQNSQFWYKTVNAWVDQWTGDKK
jgi:dipeptidyl aminopeptidase/acylaminoacyl peptidase